MADEVLDFLRNRVELRFDRLDSRVNHSTQMVIDQGRRVTGLEGSFANVSMRLDSIIDRLEDFNTRLERIERRLDLVDDKPRT
jgi:hypothetical protein